MIWTIYTFFNDTGDVIYAGMTSDLVERIRSHAKKTPWFNEVVLWRKVGYPTERDARDAEYSIIAAERPKHNERGTDICPRCRERKRANYLRAPYCAPCQSEYQTARNRARGVRPAQPPTITCPRCGGVKGAGPSYCRSCKSQINAAYRAEKAKAP